MVKILPKSPTKSPPESVNYGSRRRRKPNGRRAQKRKRDSSNFRIEEFTIHNPPLNQNDLTKVFPINQQVSYILIKDVFDSYQLENDLCCHLTLISLSSKWFLYCDGYCADYNESITLSTCFGHKTFIEFIDKEKSTGKEKFFSKEKKRKFFPTNEMNKIDSIPLSNEDRQCLLEGKFILLKLEIDMKAMSKYKMALEYMSRMDNENFNRVCKRKLFCDWSISEKTIIKHLIGCVHIREMENTYHMLGIKSNDIILICGPNNSGKTSLTNYLINRYISANRKCVYYLECDPGQTLFAPCGVLSLVKIDKKISNSVGYQFLFRDNILLTENDKIKSKIFGTISPANDSYEYLALIKQLFDSFKLMKPNQPLFINTMGWIEEFGLKLLMKIIAMIRPNHVIRIENEKYDPKFVGTKIGNSIGKYNSFPKTKDLRELFKSRKHLNFNLYITSTEMEFCNLTNITPFSSSSIRREALQLLYLISNLWPTIQYKPFYSIEPIKISLSNSYIYLANHTSLVPKSIFDLLNVSWVFYGIIDVNDSSKDDSLTYIPLFQYLNPFLQQNNEHNIGCIKLLKKLPIKSGECYGCGIIRNVNMIESTIMVTMFSSASRIDPGRINFLVLPNQICIPSGLLTEQFVYQNSCSLPYTYLIANKDC